MLRNKELEEKVNVLAQEEQKQPVSRKKQKKKQKKQGLVDWNFYGEAIIVLKDVFSRLHHIRKSEPIVKEELMESLLNLCNDLKGLFEKRYKYRYSVCLKVLGSGVDLGNIDPYAQIETLCRDIESYKGRSQPTTIKHNIFQNTCFSQIF
jgi:hypothetical protein